MAEHSRAPIAFFDQGVLASYRAEPDKWLIESDFFEGHLSTTNEYYESMGPEHQEYIDVRFGYRALVGGELAIVAWLPDLQKRSPKHTSRWRGFLLNEPEWEAEDERFNLWCQRYLEGSWDVENGPRAKLSEVLETINGLTAVWLGTPLFINPIPETLPFPSAQNTHRYQDAHLELYKFLVDGIDKNCLKELATKISIEVNVESSKTVDALKKLLPSLSGGASGFEAAYSLLSQQRGLASHKVREPARPFRAFEQFTEDLKLCVTGLIHLLGVLESVSGLNGAKANERWRQMLQLPKMVQIPEGQYSISQMSGVSIFEARKMVGKTIEKVEFGFREPMEGVHHSELLVIYFTDGSILALETGSNAENISLTHSGVKAEEFHVDFIPHWVSSLSEAKNIG